MIKKKLKLHWEKIASLTFFLILGSILATGIYLVPMLYSQSDFATVSLCGEYVPTGSNKLGLGLAQEKNPSPTNSENCYSPEDLKPLLNLDILKEDAATAPFPELNVNARLAKVPVIRYNNVLPEPEGLFDVTPEELATDFETIQEAGMTPISIDLLIKHLRTGIPLPDKPIVLSFDNGYSGHYKYVYPLLKQYSYPAIFSIYIDKIQGKTARSGVTWGQLKEMTLDPLVTIACSSRSHPSDLTVLSDSQLEEEILNSKKILEKELGQPVRYFTYPTDKIDEKVKDLVIKGGYEAALAINDLKEAFAGQSPDILEIARFEQSRLKEVIPLAWGGIPLPKKDETFNFQSIPRKEVYLINNKTIIMAIGGKPVTIHAPTRSSVAKIIEDTDAVAAVDGTFFSLKYLNSNEMIGPVLSQNEQRFIPGNNWDIEKITGRPLALIGAKWVKFIPFDPDKHNTYEGVSAESPDGSPVTDAFVAGAWLVKDSLPQSAETFMATHLLAFEVERHRAFWGINQAGGPVIGVTKQNVDSVSLGKMLAKLGLRDVIMVDSGDSADLVYLGKTQISYKTRPVPHVIALYPPVQDDNSDSLLQFPCLTEQNECFNPS